MNEYKAKKVMEILEKDLEELSPVGNKVKFTIKPYEIKTFKFKLR